MEFQPKKKDELSIHQNAEMQKKKQAKFIGSLNIHKGQKCFELNTRTGVIELAKYDTQTISYQKLKSIGSVNRKLTLNDECIYVVAINLKNAKKKFQVIINNTLKDKTQTASVDCLVCGAKKSIDIDSIVKEQVLTASITICSACGHSPKISDYIK